MPSNYLVYPFLDSYIISHCFKDFIVIFLPLTLSNLISRVKHPSSSMHHRVPELPFVYFTVIPNKCAISIQKIVLEITLVSSICSLKNSMSRLGAPYKIALIGNFVIVFQDSSSMHQPMLEVSLISLTIGPVVHSMTVLLALVEIPIIKTAIIVGLLALAFGVTVNKIAIVSHSLVDIDKRTMAPKAGVHKIALIHRTIRVDINSPTIGVTVYEIPRVVAAIVEMYDSLAGGVAFVEPALIGRVVLLDVIDLPLSDWVGGCKGAPKNSVDVIQSV